MEEQFNKLKEVLIPYFSVPDLTPAPVPKISGRYRFISFLRAPDQKKLISGLEVIKKEFPRRFKGIRYKIDVEPIRII